MRFSQRQGITPKEKQIQHGDIDKDLRNGLWNIYELGIINHIIAIYSHHYQSSRFQDFSYNLWHNFYKLPTDTIPYDNASKKEHIRTSFFSMDWHELYDFIEFSTELVDHNMYETDTDILQDEFNIVLEREFSAYRFISGKISPITNETEISEITTAMDSTRAFTSLNGCNIHLQSALDKLSNKQNPDYRNSIKESISAIESLAKVISNNSKDSLGASLDKIKGKIKLHQGLERGFKNIYGYTSDGDGIRHALMEESSCDFEDAKFMLVSCSAFINYLIAKAQKAGIEI